MDFSAKYNIRIIDRLGFVHNIIGADAEKWQAVRTAVARSEPLIVSYDGADKGMPIQYQWGGGQIVRAELFADS